MRKLWEGLMLAAFLVGLASECSLAQDSPQEQVRRTLELAKREKNPDQWAELLLRADAEAVKMESYNLVGGCCGYRCLKIGQYELTFVWHDIGATEVYQHDLLKTVLQANEGTPIGAQALTRLLEPGCGLLSNQWTPYFKTVLSMLELPRWRKLNDAGLTRIRAQAYETWWSLSKASANEPLIQDSNWRPEDFQKGAEEARLQAIAAYQDLIAQVPNDREAFEHLRKLKVGQDTYQRLWYCSGD